MALLVLSPRALEIIRDTPHVGDTVFIVSANAVRLAWELPTSQKDAAGNAYDGANKYVMHFPRGQLPPVRGFWSVTMYDDKYFFVNNPLNRYSISPRQNLKTDRDGSTDLYLQKDSPGSDKESSRLPAPAGKFILMLRMYWPNETKPSIISGSWTIPPVKKAG